MEQLYLLAAAAIRAFILIDKLGRRWCVNCFMTFLLLSVRLWLRCHVRLQLAIEERISLPQHLKLPNWLILWRGLIKLIIKYILNVFHCIPFWSKSFQETDCQQQEYLFCSVHVASLYLSHGRILLCFVVFRDSRFSGPSLCLPMGEFYFP